MVPEQTVLLYEANDCQTCSSVKPSAVTHLLETLILDFEGNDSIAKSMNFLAVPAKGNAVSVHITSKDNFDVVYYFTTRQAARFKSVADTWKATKSVRFSERKLNGMQILEYSFPNKKMFSCVQLGDAWAGSFTSFLIEDVVRTYEKRSEQSFKKQVAAVYALPRIKDDAGDIYVHLQNLTSWLNIFPQASADLKRLGDVGLLDIKRNENTFTLNGFSLAQPGASNGLLSYFLNQTPVQFTVKQYISNQTVFALNYGVSDGTALYQSLDLSKNKLLQDSLAAFVTIDYEKLFASFGKELAVCYQESKNNTLTKVVVFETQKPADWLTAFNRLADASSREDTLFHEQYSTYDLREIEIDNLIGKLFSPLTSGFAQTYYTSVGNFIILSGRLEDMKKFLDDIDQENVWGKSVAFNKFLESTLLESNLSIYVNTPLAWNSVSERLNPRWQTFIQKNKSLLNAFDLGAIQFSHLNESFYTNITWTYSDYIENKTRQDRVRPSSGRLVASLHAAVITDPVVVKSHVNRDDEVLVQDSSFVVYHLSSDGKVLWQKNLGERIVGDIHQVDFFSNGKLQFFFATAHHLHIIDRLGNYVAPYPQAIEIKDLAYVTLVDYDKSKKYRFLLTDRTGKLWMFDKDAKVLEGWTPKNAGGDLFAPARHYRIRGKDYLLAIRKDGQAYVMNRRGEMLKGFPLDLEARPNGEYYLEAGNSLESTNFVCVSRDGFRIKFNLNGKIVSRETLIKLSFDTQFGLVKERNEKSYLIKRQDAKRLTLLNEDNQEILSNDFVGINPVSIKYYDFGAGKTYITITDLSQDLSFIYDGDGKLLNATPLPGSALEIRPAKTDMPKTFLVDQNTLVIE